MENFHTHDRGYKYLFSNPLLVKELIESFTGMAWVKQVDFSKAVSINTSFVSDEFKKLPVVFPLMLYNGEAEWTAPESFLELINIPEELKSLKKYVPQFRYFSIIENRFSDRALKRTGNIAASVFLLENRDSSDFMSAIEQIKKNLKGKDLSAIKTYLVWLKKYLEVNSTIEEAQESIKQIKSEKEAQTMFAKTIEKVKQDFKNEGIQLGILLEKQNVLARLMKKKFGLSKTEAELIKNTHSTTKLEKALDLMVVTDVKDEVLRELKTVNK